MKKAFLFLSFSLVAVMAIFSAACTKNESVDCSKYNSTYNSNMKAIITSKCVSCHKAGGSAEGVGVYTSYNDMKDNLSKIWEVVDNGSMPEAGSPQLTDAEKEAFECWKNAGFPEN